MTVFLHKKAAMYLENCELRLILELLYAKVKINIKKLWYIRIFSYFFNGYFHYDFWQKNAIRRVAFA